MKLQTLIRRADIEKRITELGRQIAADFAGQELIALCILKGAIFFTTDLVRAMPMDVALDVIQVSSYGKNRFSSGVVTILKEPQLDMKGKSVLIVEDVIDSGLTIAEVYKYIESRGAVNVKVATFLDKPSARKSAFQPDYVGFSIDPHFVVGYGLDFDEKYRNLTDVHILSPEGQ
jgi:hypoxanthine phosphoribosyltransferase